jgi:uncharacterized damage-inducible protein DinB
MLKIGLIHEFKFEVENTRKLLQAIPDTALDWRPTPKNWTIAELAAHIVEIYDWYAAVLTTTHLEIDKRAYDKGDISSSAGILTKFEEVVAHAAKELEAFDESTATDKWKMTVNGHEVIPPMPRVAVFRSLLCNHLYHHRGEMVAYLRVSGNKVPGLYGPTADDAK